MLDVDCPPTPYLARLIRLLDEDATIPFIARYRKEATGGMDDVALRALDERLSSLRNLEQRKEDVILLIDAQGKRHCVKAEIAGTDSVRLLTTPNLAVTTVTYGWENNPEDANLFGSTGLPATPFMMKVGQGK